MSLPISSFMSSEHVFYRLARFNSSSRRYFNSSPILQAGSNYSLCSPNQTLTGWGMTSHWEPIKLKLIHKNSTYPLYPQKSSQLALIYSSPAAQSSLQSASTPNSTMVHRTRPASWVQSLSSPSQVQSPLPTSCCLDLFVPTITTLRFECMTHSCHSVVKTYASSTWPYQR